MLSKCEYSLSPSVINCVEIKSKYEKKMELLPIELDNMRKSEIGEREDHWNGHIAALIEDHSKALGEATALIHRMQEDTDTNEALKVKHGADI